MEGVTAAYLVPGERPALVDVGARTSAGAVRLALAGLGIGPDDLRWIVLTHVHLDHCGAHGHPGRRIPACDGAGAPARRPPSGRSPDGWWPRSARVYGARWSLYGGLDRTAARRVVAVEDGHRVDVGAGRSLVMLRDARPRPPPHGGARRGDGRRAGGRRPRRPLRGRRALPGAAAARRSTSRPATPASPASRRSVPPASTRRTSVRSATPMEALATARRQLALVRAAAEAATGAAALADGDGAAPAARVVGRGRRRARPMASSRLGGGQHRRRGGVDGGAGRRGTITPRVGYCLSYMKTVRTEIVVIGVREGGAQALLVRLPGSVWALPGVDVAPGVTLEGAALGALAEQTGIRGAHLEQLYTFDRRAGEAVCVANLCLVAAGRHVLTPGPGVVEVRWFPMDDTPALSADAMAVLDYGRSRVGPRPPTRRSPSSCSPRSSPSASCSRSTRPCSATTSTPGTSVATSCSRASSSRRGSRGPTARAPRGALSLRRGRLPGAGARAPDRPRHRPGARRSGVAAPVTFRPCGEGATR